MFFFFSAWVPLKWVLGFFEVFAPLCKNQFFDPWKKFLLITMKLTDWAECYIFILSCFFCSHNLSKKLYIGILNIDQHQSQLRSFWTNVKWSSKSFIECFCWSSVLWLHGRCQRVLLYLLIENLFKYANRAALLIWIIVAQLTLSWSIRCKMHFLSL